MYHFKIRHIIRTASLIGNCRCVDLASDKSRVVVSGIASLSIFESSSGESCTGKGESVYVFITIWVQS